MRISRLLAGQRTIVKTTPSLIPGDLPQIEISPNQLRMQAERERIAALPYDDSFPSRQAKRARERAVAKARRAGLRKMAGSKRSFVAADWRAFLTA